ncbi:DNA methyltransferase [Clostridium sporogenes]|uniref:DNA methyltransferase n=1 Tax=Clostridium sporogenes TaxID=1509 RepID=UPI0022380223|nr:DNA methyltransferase [Clostridium sporogenes]MCW6107997.1 DNA adenine methylase [Clostridium sporogenes]
MSTISILNYQGNKTSLMPFINENIKKYISPRDTVCDIFAGSGSVGSSLKDEYTIVANDMELYSSIISSALLNTPSKSSLTDIKKTFESSFKITLKKKLRMNESIVAKERTLLSNDDNDGLVSLYNGIPTIWNMLDNNVTAKTLRKRNNYDLFLRYYSGSYFGIEQSIVIDALVQSIKTFDGNESDVLFACLFFAMKETVFSKDGHMAQPLNIEKNSSRHLTQRKKDVFYYFIVKLDEFIEKAGNYAYTKNKIYNKDLTDLLLDKDFLENNDIKLIYADPPYTDMQYSRYYHLLNVAARYDYPEPTILRGTFTKGLYTEGRNQSELSKKSTAKNRFYDLFTFCKENNILLALSYAYPRDLEKQNVNRYTISIEELVEMAKEIFGAKKVQIEQKEYKHANHRNSFSKEVLEYLIICGQEIHKSSYDLIGLKSEIKKLTPTSKNPIYNTHLYWSQKSFNVIAELIKHLSKENEIVFDPFMGSGVTVIEAVQKTLNRIGIGCDVNEMPKFIVNNVLEKIPQANLNTVFSDFKTFLQTLEKYYYTKCPICEKNAVVSKVVFDKPERTQNNFLIKAISLTCDTCGKQTKKPDSSDYELMSIKKKNGVVYNRQLIQNSKIAVGVSDTISDIFTPRNFSVLDDIVEYIKGSQHQDILNYLLMSVIHLSKITDMHSNSQWPLWIPKVNCVEKNIVDLLTKRMTNLTKAKKYIKDNYEENSIVNHFSDLKQNKAMILTKGSQWITDEEIPDDSVSLIITDPPYMDQVLYSEYMQLYEPFIGLSFNLEDEIIVSSSAKRKRNKDEYFKLLNDVFRMCSKKLKENHFMCLFFHDSNLDVWSNLINILENNGFRFISQEHIKKSKTVKNILSPKKSLSGDAILFFENTCVPIPEPQTYMGFDEIKNSVYNEAKKMLEKNGDLSTPELYDMGIMEMLIENGWLQKLSLKYKSLVDIFEEFFVWKSETGKWHLQQ